MYKVSPICQGIKEAWILLHAGWALAHLPSKQCRQQEFYAGQQSLHAGMFHTSPQKNTSHKSALQEVKNMCGRQVARLRSHLEQIKRDDRMIKAEGLEALSEDELRQACRARGMRAPFGEGAVVFMRKQLKEWLDLSLNRRAPASLLCL